MAVGTGESAETAGSAGKLNVKRPGATRLWLTVIMSVLLVLWWQTHSETAANYNLFLNGESSAVGADVSIDGQPAGKMSESASPSLGGAVFYARLDNGRHVLEVKKSGYKPFSKEINMQTKDYVSVDLQSESGEKDEAEEL